MSKTIARVANITNNIESQGGANALTICLNYASDYQNFIVKIDFL